MNFKYLILIFLISCQKDIREFFIHPLTNFRVGQSLSESITKPSDLFPQKTHFKFIAFGDPQSQSDGKNNLSKLSDNDLRNGKICRGGCIIVANL